MLGSIFRSAMISAAPRSRKPRGRLAFGLAFGLDCLGELMEFFRESGGVGNWRGLYRPPDPAARNRPTATIKHYKSNTYKNAGFPLARTLGAMRTSFQTGKHQPGAARKSRERRLGRKQSLSRCGL